MGSGTALETLRLTDAIAREMRRAPAQRARVGGRRARRLVRVPARLRGGRHAAARRVRRAARHRAHARPARGDRARGARRGLSGPRSEGFHRAGHRAHGERARPRARARGRRADPGVGAGRRRRVREPAVRARSRRSERAAPAADDRRGAARRGSTRSRCSRRRTSCSRSDALPASSRSSRSRDRGADLERRGGRRRRRVQHVHRAPDRVDREVVDELAVGADRLRAHARRRGREVGARRSPAPGGERPRRIGACSASASSRRRRSASGGTRTCGSPEKRERVAEVPGVDAGATRIPRGRRRARHSGRCARDRRSRASRCTPRNGNCGSGTG